MVRFATALSALAFALISSPDAGELNPPGAPSATNPTFEPRTPISSLPITITEPGSYYLTGNLSVTNQTAIGVSVEGVTIDLNGFTISGTTGGYWHGIDMDETAASTTVHNGYIVGFGGDGISAFFTPQCRISDVTVRNCGSIGIIAGTRCIIERCEVRGNAASGMIAGGYGVIVSCTASNNGQSGIGANESTAIENCSSVFNGGAGISALYDCAVTNCAVSENGEAGIVAYEGTVIENCTSKGNTLSGIVTGAAAVVRGCASLSNDLNGIEVNSSGTVVMECNTYFNAQAGILVGFFGTGCRIDGNNMTRNGIGIQTNSAGAIVIRNTMSSNDRSGSVVNFSFAADTAVGFTVDVTGSIGFTGGTPWSNFVF